MNKNYLALLTAPAAAIGLLGNCVAAPSAAFVPAESAAAPEFNSKANADIIQIMTYVPVENVTILGVLKIQGDASTSLHELMVAALDAAKDKGANFLAIAKPGTQPSMFLGKMVPAGHGRSMFVAATVQGSEVGRIASIPSESSGSISLIVGIVSKKDV